MSFPRRIQSSTRRYSEAVELAVGHGTPVRAAKLAIVVGTLLVLINQWEAIVGPGRLDWLKLVLTYCVPFMVSTYTSVSKDLNLKRETEAAEQRVHEEARGNRSRGGAV